MTECSEAVGVRRADVVHKLVIYLDFSTRSSLRFTGRFGKRKYSASGISWWLLRAQWKATAAQLLQLRCKEDMWNLEGYQNRRPHRSGSWGRRLTKTERQKTGKTFPGLSVPAVTLSWCGQNTKRGSIRSCVSCSGCCWCNTVILKYYVVIFNCLLFSSVFVVSTAYVYAFDILWHICQISHTPLKKFSLFLMLTIIQLS